MRKKMQRPSTNYAPTLITPNRAITKPMVHMQKLGIATYFRAKGSMRNDADFYHVQILLPTTILLFVTQITRTP